MKNNLFLVVILLAIIPNWISAQDRIYHGYKEFENKIEVYVNDGHYIIKPFTEKIIETSFIPEGEKYNPNSHAVVLNPDKVNVTLIENDEFIKYSTQGIKVSIQKAPFNITYFYKNDTVISEGKGYVNGEDFESLNFRINKNEKLYGGGTRVLGMDRRGNRLQLYNRAHYGYEIHSELMNYTTPLVVSSNLYAIHFDNAPIGYLDLDSKQNNNLTYETISGRKTYQIVVGDTWEDLLDQYTNLTGKQPLPPLWAFGNFSSRFGYHSEKEVKETVNKFIEDDIPLDAVVIDIYWFGKDIKGHMGNLSFLKDSFPTPYKMIDDFKKKGVKTILVTEPFILTTSNRWDEAVEKNLLATDSAGNPYTYDFYFGNTGLLDIYKTHVEEWFWNIYKYYTEKGVGGWWGDLGEPEVHPSDIIHAAGTGDEVHNIYGHDWTRLIYEGYQKDFPNQRPFILMRAGYSGSQRYGIIPWTGDVSRSWGGLKPQMQLSLQMGLQGIAYLHSDLGGFAGGEEFDSELYTRWLQYGVFQPIYRPHAQEHIASEPVFHDLKTKDLARKSIKLRYSMLPYIYTLAFENSRTGKPFMRPLFFGEPENDSIYEITETYLWGKDFLISAVTDPGHKSKKVYMPKGSVWFDFFTDDFYAGGKTYDITLQEDHIPVFVRAGSFIPMVKPIQSTKDYTTKELNIHYYKDQSVVESFGKIYVDDGITPDAFEKGMYEIMKFKGSNSNNNLSIQLTSELGINYDSTDRKINLIIHNCNTKPKNIHVNNEKHQFTWKKENGTTELGVDWNSSEQIIIDIQY